MLIKTFCAEVMGLEATESDKRREVPFVRIGRHGCKGKL